ncbi:hypothetical protein BGZ51_006815 [Haplosporangium sp. Z 767]|nr:hypothetical protein BGZ51_006815 [Haplosporangium sp. Z 767]
MIQLEIITLLQSAVDFAHWASGFDNPTILKIYSKIYNMLPALESSAMTETRGLHINLETLIKDSRSLKDIPDAILLAIYLNPVCALLDTFELAISADGIKLRDKSRILAIEAIIKLNEEGESAMLRRSVSRQEDGQSSQPKPSSAYSAALFKLHATYMVEAYSVQIKSNSTKYAGCMYTPQVYWQERQSDAPMRDLVCVARSYLHSGDIN